MSIREEGIALIGFTLVCAAITGALAVVMGDSALYLATGALLGLSFFGWLHL